MAKTDESGLSRYKWLISPLLTIIFVLAGVIVTWTTTKADVAYLKLQVSKQEEVIQNTNNKLISIQTKEAVIDQILKNINGTLNRLEEGQKEIKKDIKSLSKGDQHE